MKGKRILITGGAGGLGAVACWAFAAQGARVIALDHGTDIEARLDTGRTAFEAGAGVELDVGPGTVDSLHADLADTHALNETIHADMRRNGGFDVLINNAAIYPSRPVLDYQEAELLRVHAINVHAPMVLAQWLTPSMRAQGWGRIINLSSITFYGGWGNLLPYVASKGALVGTTRALARELGPYGITVNCVSPGAFPTAAEAIHPDPAGYNAFVLERQSIKHRGHAIDIANALLFLASDASRFITGQTLAVDGGWYMN